MRYYTEKALITTLIYSPEFIDEVDFEPDYFQDPYHNKIAKIIKQFRDQGRYANEFDIRDYLAANSGWGINEEQIFINLLITNCLGSVGSFKTYFEDIKKEFEANLDKRYAI